MEERQVRDEDVVEVDHRMVPGVVEVLHRAALRLVGDDRVVHQLSVGIDATVEAAAEQRHAHDAEDEPEDKADEEDVEYRWYRLDESVDDDLHTKYNTVISGRAGLYVRTDRVAWWKFRLIAICRNINKINS